MGWMIERLPTELIDVYTLADGRQVTVRPVLPQDAALQRELVRALSGTARYQRFFAPIHELPASWLARMTQLDFERHVGLIAESFGGGDGVAVPVAEARYVLDDAGAAEFALVVADAWQRQGIARRLLDALACHARSRGVPAMHGETFADNAAMLGLARRAGFRLLAHPGDARLVRLERRLQGDDAGARPCRGASVRRGSGTAAGVTAPAP